MPPWLRPASKRDSYCRAVNEVGRAVRVVAFERLQVHATLQCLQFVRVTNSHVGHVDSGCTRCRGPSWWRRLSKKSGLSWRHYLEWGLVLLCEAACGAVEPPRLHLFVDVPDFFLKVVDDEGVFVFGVSR